LNLRPRSIRVRLTLGYALALATILAAFSVAVFLLVRASLLHEVQERAEQSLAVVQRLVVDGAQEADEIEEHGIVALFALQHEGAAGYVSTAWRRQGLPEPYSLATEPRLRRWRSDDGRSYAIAGAASAAAGQPLTILVAVDEDPVLEHLRTLGLVLLLGFPAAIAAAVIGGSLLAKRMLSPVGAMADAAGRITAERLSERLPIEDAEDEFGRLAGVFNQTLARLQDAFERLQRFTADASHELRTPLTALRSVGEVALRAPDFHQRSRETIVSMLEESERLTQLVDGLLMLTRESTEAYRARFAPVDLGKLSSEVVELLRALSEEREQRLDALAEGDVVVHGDHGTLRQALINLVDNAIKYTPRGGSIRVHVHPAGGADVVVQVSDTGPGIAEEHRHRIFERFYRVDHDRSRSTGGAGLGLAIARWAAELNGGRIELESTPGEGSTFTLRVPRAAPSTNRGPA
jgi:heavy metal sensor kinase